MPRPAIENDLIDFVGRVPREKYEALRLHFPFYGFNGWLVNTIIDSLLDEVQGDPTAVDRVRLAVQRSVRRDPT